ncbi:VOC family protein [Qaidamihabitans albus]|uniref:VOC family protein n=1 Tax=Qaidamihabitans albus TaxID=2795733 RepID=UPI0018F1A9D7|nr:VOC family protein [Qaidamihabitans albus]
MSAQPAVVPYLLCSDVAAEAEWLAKAFGFTVRHQATDETGRVTHAELETGGGGVVMLGDPGPDYRNPAAVGHATQLQLVTVADVDQHYATAVAEGARVVAELTGRDYGRSYGAEDREGHQWYFVAGSPPS